MALDDSPETMDVWWKKIRQSVVVVVVGGGGRKEDIMMNKGQHVVAIDMATSEL